MRVYLTMMVLAMFAILLSCAGNSDKEVEGQSGYFNMEEFLQNEIGDTQVIDVFKLIYRDGELVDSQRTDDYVPFRDLRAFRKADISAPASRGKYEVDTLRGQGLRKEVVYTARKKDLNTRKLSVVYDLEKIDRILMKRRFNSLISSIDQEALFVPDSVYDIRSLIVDKISGDSSDLRIRVFLNQ